MTTDDMTADHNHFRVEVVHSRDPDSECSIQIWIDGERVPDAQVYVADLDPGSSGPALSEWDEQTDEIARDQRLTPDFREAVVEERESFRESSWIEDDRPKHPVDETVDSNGEWLPRGRCDTCGSPCDADTGDCMRDATHPVALA